MGDAKDIRSPLVFRAPVRSRSVGEVPPWPIPALPWRLSWAAQEMELQEELRSTAAELCRLRASLAQARDLGLGEDYRRAIRETANRVQGEYASLKTDLVWVSTALDCGT